MSCDVASTFHQSLIVGKRHGLVNTEKEKMESKAELEVGTHGSCSPGHRTHFEPWFLESNDII